MDLSLNILAERSGSFWLPPQASSIAPEVDWLFSFVLWISVFFFLLIAALLVIFAWKYRYREDNKEPAADAPKHNTAAELTWTFIPTVLVVVIFWYGFIGYIHMSVPPQNADSVLVNAQMWSYSFTFPNGNADEDLYLPVNKPVILHMQSADVIHGFYIPAFRIKKDIVPQRDNILWVEPTMVTGRQDGFDIYCTQYCGKQHSEMRRKAHVLDQDDYNDWLAHADDAIKKVPWLYGQKMYHAKGCISCHTIDGSKGIGPTWKDIWGTTVSFTNHDPVVVNPDYVRQMVHNNNQWVLKDFPNPAMPLIPMSDEQLDDLIAFISSPNDQAKAFDIRASTQPSAAGEAATQPSK